MKDGDGNVWDSRESHLDEHSDLIDYLGGLVWNGRGRNREGWLTPDGIFLEVGVYDHDRYAVSILGHKQSTLALHGWIKIDAYGKPNMFGHQVITEEQAKWLLERNP